MITFGFTKKKKTEAKWRECGKGRQKGQTSAKISSTEPCPQLITGKQLCGHSCLQAPCSPFHRHKDTFRHFPPPFKLVLSRSGVLLSQSVRDWSQAIGQPALASSLEKSHGHIVPPPHLPGLDFYFFHLLFLSQQVPCWKHPALPAEAGQEGDRKSRSQTGRGEGGGSRGACCKRRRGDLPKL